MKQSILLLTIVLLSVAGLLYYSPGTAAIQGNATLFDLVGTQARVALPSSTEGVSVAAVRSQLIQVNVDRIDFEKAQELTFQLLDGQNYTAVRNSEEGFVPISSSEFSWRGKITNADNSTGDVILAFKDGYLSGLIFSPTAVYEIVPQSDFKHILVELDQSRFPACGGAIEAPISTTPTGNSSGGDEVPSLPSESDDGSSIDVLVVYTSKVRAALGGTSQAQAFAQEAIASTNTAYLNSGITTRVRLVKTVEVNYDEASGTLAAALD